MGFGKGSNQTTTQTGPSPQAGAAYSDLLNRAGNVANTPYTPYGGELVAGINQQQNLGIGGINQNAGFAQPFIGQAAQYANNAAQPITGQQIAQYQSPYTQQAVNATQAQFANQNAQQQSALTGNAAAQGALGGDRVGVAQGILGGQQALAQAPVIAGLYNQGYQSAAQLALSQQQAQANAAYSLGNLGVAGQGAALQGAGAQIGAGTLQQQTQQALDAAKLQQFYQQQAYPFQTTQWLAGIDTGVGSQMGGTSTTTPPQPNPWNTALGLGLAGAAIFADRGGRIHRDVGGGVGAMPYAGVSGYVPTIQIARGQGAPKPPTVPGAAAPDFKAYAQAGKGLGNLFGGDTSSSDLGNTLGGVNTAGSVPDFNLGLGSLYRRGGAVPHFEAGGTAMAGLGTGAVMPDSFDDRFYVPSPPVNPAAYNAIQDWGTTRPAAQDSGLLATPMAENVPVPRPRPEGLGDAPVNIAGNPDLPPEIAGQPTAQAQDDGVLAYGPGARKAGFEGAAQPADEMGTDTGLAAAPNASGDSGLLSRLGLNLSPAARQGLLAAGFGIMASRSPFLGEAIGQGGLQGIATYSGEKKQELTEKKTQADIEHGKNQLAQQAKLAADRIKMETARLAQTERLHMTMTPAQQQQIDLHKQQLEEAKRQHDMTLKAPVKIGDDPRTGMPIMALPRLNSQNGNIDYYMIHPDGSIDSAPLGTKKPDAPAATMGPSSALPSSPLNAGTRVAALETGTATDAPKAGEGIIQYNNRLAQAPYDYTANAPYIEKGMAVPDPQAIAGRSAQALKMEAEYYLQTGKLPPVRSGNSPVARVQQNYRNAVQNYGAAMAQSQGLTPADTAEMWRTAPGMLRFVLGADGRATVSLGTAVRHLDTMDQLVDAWKQGSTIGDWRMWNQVTSSVRRQFGDAAVTNLQAAGQIIGPEVLKAIGVAGAGGEAERQAVGKLFDPGSTPDQIKGAIHTLQELLGGQLEGKKRQAANAGVSEQRFRNLIGDRPYEILTHKNQAPAAAAPAISPGMRVGEERQFKQGIGVWNGQSWVPKGTQ